jgi:hypothetical protein
LVSVTVIGLEEVFSACAVVNVKLEGERLTTGVVPVPVSATGANGVAASLLMVIVAVWVPVAVGLKTTLTLQAPEAGTMVPQLFTAENWAAEGPLMVIPVMFTGNAVPLVKVTACAAVVAPRFALPKLSAVGLRDAPAPPMPVSGKTTGVGEALLVMERVPVRLPDAVGVKVTAITHVPFAGNEVVQLPACATTWKSPVVTGVLKVSGKV